MENIPSLVKLKIQGCLSLQSTLFPRQTNSLRSIISSAIQNSVDLRKGINVSLAFIGFLKGRLIEFVEMETFIAKGNMRKILDLVCKLIDFPSNVVSFRKVSLRNLMDKIGILL